jgi:DNA primase
VNDFEFKEYCKEIRLNNKITDYVKQVGLEIKDKGGRQWVRCPFHNEKTPSLNIFPTTEGEAFHCFGCGASGSIIDFVKDYEKINLAQAIKKLGSGIDVDFDIEKMFERFEESIKEDVKEVLFFKNNHISKTCFNYLREIKNIVPESVYDEEFDKINSFYERLDVYVKKDDLEAIESLEDKICNSDFIVDKVVAFRGEYGEG